MSDQQDSAPGRRRYGWFSPELRSRAVEAVRELRPHVGSTEAACRAVAEQIGCSLSSVRAWLRDAGGIDRAETSARETALEQQLRIAAAMNQDLAAIARGRQ